MSDESPVSDTTSTVVTSSSSSRTKTLRMKTYISVSSKKFKEFTRFPYVPLAFEFAEKSRNNTVDLIQRHDRIVQQKVPIDLWLRLLPYVTHDGLRKLLTASSMTMF
eukprot:PhF_6_TR42181/c0_g1_i5/m.63794